MFKKGSKLYSIINNKCPRCNEGDYFIEKSLFSIKKLTKIHNNCSNCNQKYMLEPSFYFGAMYVNYALAVAFSVASFIITSVLLNMDMFNSFISIFATLIITMPISLKLSRIIWINFFVSFEKDWKNKVE